MIAISNVLRQVKVKELVTWLIFKVCLFDTILKRRWSTFHITSSKSSVSIYWLKKCEVQSRITAMTIQTVVLLISSICDYSNWRASGFHSIFPFRRKTAQDFQYIGIYPTNSFSVPTDVQLKLLNIKQSIIKNKSQFTDIWL